MPPAGSRQVEASDEGMMTEEIEQCLRVVLDATIADTVKLIIFDYTPNQM